MLSSSSMLLDMNDSALPAQDRATRKDALVSRSSDRKDSFLDLRHSKMADRSKSTCGRFGISSAGRRR